MPDLSATFAKIGDALAHLLNDSKLEAAQEAEIKATIAELKAFEGSVSDLIDQKIDVALAVHPQGGSSDVDARLTAIENGLNDLGHVFTDTNSDSQSGGDQSEAGADTTSGADSVSGQAGDDSVTGTDTTTGQDTTAGADSVTSSDSTAG